MTKTTTTYRIRYNIWGNWHCYISGRNAGCAGPKRYHALEWLNEMSASNPPARVRVLRNDPNDVIIRVTK